MTVNGFYKKIMLNSKYLLKFSVKKFIINIDRRVICSRRKRPGHYVSFVP